MSDETIAVTIQETTLPVSIDTGTPQLSIIEQSGDVTIIEANPIQVIATEGDATVVINSGVYGSANPINVEDLVGYITRLQLDPDLTTDMEHLDAMWTQIGGKTVLLGSDGIAIRLAGQAYTDSSILTATTDINADVDSKISNSTAANSLITDALDDRITSVNMDLSLDIGETNTAIENLDLRVTSIQQDTLEDLGIINTSLSTLGQTVTNNKAEIDGRLSALDLFVGTTDTSIYSVVSRLDAIDGATGNIVDLESSIAQTADSINLRVTSLETSVDGRITSAESRISVTENFIDSTVLKFTEIDGTTASLQSSITQTADSIDSRITSIEASVDGRFSTNESRIYQTEQGILSTVTSINGITGENGSLSLLQSSIDQQAGSIEMAVQESARINGKLIETSSNLSLLTDSVALMATEYNEVEGRVTSAELILGVDGINISLIENALGLQSYTIGTIQNILTNQWTVNVLEDVAGNVYTTGFGLVLHPIWLVGEDYTTGFIVTADTAVYECILSHTSSAANSPLIAGGASYWSLLPDGVKSEFNIQADAFRIMTSSGPVPVFEVTEDVITLNANVTIGGTLTIGYSDVVGAPTSLSELDSASFTTLQTTAGYAAQAIQDAADAKSTADGKIEAFYQASQPAVASVGDLWIDTDDNNKMYTYTGSSWVVAQNQLIGTALSTAQTAQTLADSKAVIFYSASTPTGYKAGDLWYDTDDTQKRLYRYSGSDWQVVSSYGATWGTDISNQPTSLSQLNATEYNKLITAAANAAQAIQDAATAQETADGKITSFYQSSAPTSGYDVGDFWIDTDGGNKLYRRSSSAWVPVQDNAIQTALNNAQTAQTTADGKAEVFYSTTTPTGMSVGDLWYNSTTKLLQRYSGSAWQYVSSYGATWGTNITNQPTSLSAINAAEYGRLPAAALGALAYLNTVGNDQVTTIHGGKIQTGVIYGNNSYSYWDLTNNKMYFTASANVEFASHTVVKFGAASKLTGSGGESIYFNGAQIFMTSTTGNYFYLYNGYSKLISNGNTSIVAGSASLPIDDSVTSLKTACVVAAGNIYINPGTSYIAYIRFGSTNKIQINQYGMRPSANNGMLLGDTGYRWSGVYGSAFYDEGGLFQDLQDDLLVMSEIKPKKHINIDPESGEKQTSIETLKDSDTELEYIDLHSLPRWMTNYDLVAKKLKEDSGDLLSDDDIDELILDDNEAGWMLSRNIGRFNDLTSGAVRQMDIENKEMYELIFSRLTALEKENKELKERVTVLEGEKVK